MKKSILLLAILCRIALPEAYSQRMCGMEQTKANLIAMDPSWAQTFAQQRASLQGIADQYLREQAAPSSAERTTTTGTVPVIFHILVTVGEFDTLGGEAGIAQRVDSQIAVLNRDYNALNPDASLIPSGWLSRFGNSNIHFGLAHTRPDGYGSPGYEIRIVPNTPGGFFGKNVDYSSAKYATTGGLDAWDVTKYMNVWCLNFADVNGLLGLTVAKSFTVGSSPHFPPVEEGICINWAVLGNRTLPTDYFIPTGYGSDYYDMGRTLTHEVGHFFEIWHTWGDDGGLCPWEAGGADDGLSDTPPEGSSKFYNYPDTIPGGTYYDNCRLDGGIDTQRTMYGVASLDFMNYTDDIAMHLFTTQQAAVMASMVLSSPSSTTGANGSGLVGENNSLIQNPGLLLWSSKTATPELTVDNAFTLGPNPTDGLLGIYYNHSVDQLLAICVSDLSGRPIRTMNTLGSAANYYSIDLSGEARGIYFVRCNFVSGTITRKIVLQ